MDAPAVRGGQLHGENSVSFGCVEALRDRVECAFAADEDEGQIQIGGCTENAMKVHHQLTDDGAGINESHVALVDTACTSCMHSRKWREEYSKSLPEGYACEKTEKFKVPRHAYERVLGGRVPRGEMAVKPPNGRESGVRPDMAVKNREIS